MNPPSLMDAWRGAEAPLFHVTAGYFLSKHLLADILRTYG
jgi:hypothetical protein